MFALQFSFINSDGESEHWFDLVTAMERIELDPTVEEGDPPAATIEIIEAVLEEEYPTTAIENIVIEDPTTAAVAMDCIICLEELNWYELPKNVVVIPCGHVFHDMCIIRWLIENNACPLCRFPMVVELMFEEPDSLSDLEFSFGRIAMFNITPAV